ncbi:MAG TPA: hypothetical protein PLQ97_06250 [Myxococcota bacterium]|nr:hypothetical protein [Myxococcota bacterium]HQK50263.1 hypothetical protein [Myxococcota bacterium]
MRRGIVCCATWLALLAPLPGEARDLAGEVLRDADGRPVRVFGEREVREVREDQALHLLFEDPTGVTVEVRLEGPQAGPGALEHTPSFQVRFLGPMVGDRPAPPWDRVVAEVVRVVRQNDPGGLALAEARAPGPDDHPRGLVSEPFPQMRTPEDRRRMASLDAWMRALGLVLTALFVLTLPWAARGLAWDLFRGGTGRGLRVVAAVLLAAGLLVRLMAPRFLIMHYMGWQLEHQVWEWTEVPKYGAGALAVYRWLFLVTGPSAEAMTWLNSALGSLMPLAAGALMAGLGAGSMGRLAALGLVALAPVMVRDATTESLLVPNLLWTLGGLALLLRARRTGSLADLALAGTMVALAMTSRPESLVLVPLAAAGVLWAAPREGLFRARHLWWIGLPLVLVLGARLVHLAAGLEVERSVGNLPSVFSPWAWPVLLARDLPRRSLVTWFHLFPAAATVLAAFAPLVSVRRRAAWVLWGLALAWTAVSLVDLPYVSVQRVQAPAAAFVLMAAALGIEGLLGLRDRLPRPSFAMLALAVVLALVGSSLVTVPGLWARTHAADEEALIARALREVGSGPAVLVRRGYLDSPGERLHLHYPDDRFHLQGVVTLGPDAFLAAGAPLDVPVFFLRGTRCWLRACDASAEEHPACRAMMDRFRLEPVVEQRIPLRPLPVDRDVGPRHDLDFPWCLADPEGMTIGLYRVLGPRDP